MEYGFERPVALWRGVLYEGTVSKAHEQVEAMHSFGGALDLEITGLPLGTRPIHRLLTIDLSDEELALPATPHRLLPLCYGFVYSGCHLSYELLEPSGIALRTFEPKTATKDWPYPDYPKQFEKRAITWRRVRAISEKEAQALTWQGFDVDIDRHMLVVVPSSKEYGVSLWGDAGDAEQVQVVFSYDPASSIVQAANQCS